MQKILQICLLVLFDLAITNAYILSQLIPDNRVKHLKDFQASLAKELIGSYSGKKRAGRPTIGPPKFRFCQHHFPMKVEKSYHRCHYCHNYRKQRLVGVAMNASCTFVTLDSKRVTAFGFTTPDTSMDKPATTELLC